MAIKLLKSVTVLAIFFNVCYHLCSSSSIPQHLHHSLPELNQDGQNHDRLYPFRTTFIVSGETLPVATLDWRIDREENSLEFRLRTAMIRRGENRDNGEWIAFVMSNNESLVNADLFLIWTNGNTIQTKVRYHFDG